MSDTLDLDLDALRMRCGRCGAFQAADASARERGDGWWTLAFACSSEDCREAGAGTLLEVPEAAGDSVGRARVDVRDVSVRCLGCDGHPTLAYYRREVDERGEGWNVYTYACEAEVCAAQRSREMLLRPAIDVFARRDPAWHGGEAHAGAEERADRRRRGGLTVLDS